MITDPPYNVGMKYGEKTNDSRTFEDFKAWCLKWAELSPEKKVLTVGIQRLVWWDSILGDPKWIIAWIKKNGQGNTNLGGVNKWDAILLYNVEADGEIDIVEIPVTFAEHFKAEGIHPTAKPVQLYEYLLRRFTKPKQTMVDFFGGTGTSIIACENNDRNNRTMEIDPFYCTVIIERWERLTGQKAERI